MNNDKLDKLITQTLSSGAEVMTKSQRNQVSMFCVVGKYFTKKLCTPLPIKFH